MTRSSVLIASAITLALALAMTAAASAAVPIAATGSASAVSYSSTVLLGSVDPRGQATNFVFQYGPTRAYGSQTPLSPAGAGTKTVRVSQSLTGLQALTTYHYRIVASSAAGTRTGGDRTFTTRAIPLSLAIAGIPDPVTFGSSFLLEGTLSGTGAGNHQIMLQSNPYPYLGGFRPVGNVELTNATGVFSFPYLGLLENTQLRVVTIGKNPVSSPIVLENVAVRVSFHAGRARQRGFVHLYGTVTPAQAGALVGFQLLQPGHRSVNEGGTGVRAGAATFSTFSQAVRIRRSGLYRALVQVKDPAHVSSYSAPILIR